MPKNGKKSDNSDVTPYKEEEFNAFLDTLSGDTSFHWVQIARALGVDQDTITKWKRMPAARKAIRDGIAKSLKGMEDSGASDWRMHESKLKMLGIAPVEKIDHSTLGEALPTPIYGGKSTTKV